MSLRKNVANNIIMEENILHHCHEFTSMLGGDHCKYHLAETSHIAYMLAYTSLGEIEFGWNM